MAEQSAIVAPAPDAEREVNIGVPAQLRRFRFKAGTPVQVNGIDFWLEEDAWLLGSEASMKQLMGEPSVPKVEPGE